MNRSLPRLKSTMIMRKLPIIDTETSTNSTIRQIALQIESLSNIPSGEYYFLHIVNMGKRDDSCVATYSPSVITFVEASATLSSK